MEIRFIADVQKWIQTYESYARQASALPDIDCPDRVHVHYFFDFPTDEEDRVTLRNQFEQYLLSASDYRIARFVVLCFYYDGLADIPPDEAMMDRERWEAARKMCAEDLRYFLDVPPTIDAIEDPEQLLWEMIQACLARHWPRAQRVCERLECFPPQDLCDPKLFFVRLVWLREIHNTFPSVNRRRIAFDWWDLFSPRLFSEPHACATESSLPVVRQALVYLENAFERKADIPVASRAIQCDLLTACGRFEEAARVAEQFGLQTFAFVNNEFYRILSQLSSEPGSDASQDADTTRNDEKGLVAKYIGECLAAAGRATEAIGRMEEAIALCPEMKGWHRRAAELYAREQKFIEATRHLALERELDPEDEAWKDPIRNIAATVHREFEMLGLDRDRQKGEYENASGSAKDAIQRTIVAYWPVFRTLHQEAKRRWVNGCFWLFGDHRAQDWSQDDRFWYAVVDLAVAVECQLFTFLFVPFKENQGARLAEAAVKCQDKRLSEFALFLSGDYRLTMGSMLAVLQMARDGAQEPLTAAFHHYLKNRLGRNLSALQSDKWKVIAQARNKQLHPPSAGGPSALKVFDLCRDFLSTLHAEV
ncbi:MAG: hypothetical protein KatS3mg005_0768 [Bryobacteraceae bacterium]|nr:MAG: hypothetical protein KatS3mg005_0768 [Bryobacteraceae bacterium]